MVLVLLLLLLLLFDLRGKKTSISRPKICRIASYTAETCGLFVFHQPIPFLLPAGGGVDDSEVVSSKLVTYTNRVAFRSCSSGLRACNNRRNCGGVDLSQYLSAPVAREVFVFVFFGLLSRVVVGTPTKGNSVIIVA